MKSEPVLVQSQPRHGHDVYWNGWGYYEHVTDAEKYNKWKLEAHLYVSKDRDYLDLYNPHLAVYNYRGHTVIRYNKYTKQLTFGDDANCCMFGLDDYLKMAEFLNKVHAYQVGEITELESVEVN